jgi:general secretion pathway protein K
MLRRQRGVAVITALLLTTLAVTIVASLFWQQQVQVRSMENQRLHLQTKWIVRGALDWASLVLQTDGRDNATFTSLDHVWATPLAETRLDQYIERERIEGEVFNATLSGSIVDATSRFNLANLASKGKVVPEQLAVFRRLLTNMRLDPALAARTAKVVAAAQPFEPDPQKNPSDPPPPVPPEAGSVPLQLTGIDDLLAIPGYSIEAVARLREVAMVLPGATKINVNTAGAEVLAAVLKNYSLSEANSLIVRRKQTQFRSKEIFKAAVGDESRVDMELIEVLSSYFLVRCKVRLDRAALDVEALVERQAGGRTNLIWVRQN